MTTTIYVSDDGYYMTEAQARPLSPGCELPTEIKVLRRNLTATMIAEGTHLKEQEVSFDVFRPVGIEVTRPDFDEEDVAIAIGRRLRRWQQ